MTRIAIVDNEKLRNMQEKLYIQSLCPVNRTGKECIRIDGNGKLTIEEKLCTGCGICPKAAPLAIKIINLPEKLKQKPIHRYGENQFVLYSMPTPLKGRVTGDPSFQRRGHGIQHELVLAVAVDGLLLQLLREVDDLDGQWRRLRADAAARAQLFLDGELAVAVYPDALFPRPVDRAQALDVELLLHVPQLLVVHDGYPGHGSTKKFALYKRYQKNPLIAL